MPDVRIEESSHLMVVTLDRASHKNAITDAMYGDIAAALTRARADPQVHAVLLTAEGPDFCAGNDIQMFLDATTGEKDIFDSNVEHFLTALSTFPKPLIAAVRGNAIGVGVTMLLHCDLIYVAEDARLKLPFIDLGLVPEAGSARLLPALVGHPRAFAIFALGEAFSGRTAVELGLANSALPQHEVVAAALAAAQSLVRKSPAALAATKALMRDAPAIQAALAADRAAFLERLASPEAAAALAAFVNRRRGPRAGPETES
jgi:enoyl-CoA hydratase/carnithine racemase